MAQVHEARGRVARRLLRLIPHDAAEDLADVRQVRVRPEGWPLHCPPTGWYQCGRMWLHRPDGSGRLNDPTQIAAALGPGGVRLAAEASG
jgi:hypothetical protein